MKMSNLKIGTRLAMAFAALAGVLLLAGCSGNGPAPDEAAIRQIVEREDGSSQVQVTNLKCSPSGQKGQWGCSFDFKGMTRPQMFMPSRPYERKGMAVKVEHVGELWVRRSL